VVDKFSNDEVEWFIWAVKYNYPWLLNSFEPLNVVATRILNDATLDGLATLRCETGVPHKWSLFDTNWEYLWKDNDIPLPTQDSRLRSVKDYTDDGKIRHDATMVEEESQDSN